MHGSSCCSYGCVASGGDPAHFRSIPGIYPILHLKLTEGLVRKITGYHAFSPYLGLKVNVCQLTAFTIHCLEIKITVHS